MRREQRHMPCRFKVDRIRASYTRIHKALAWLRDAVGTPQFDAMLAGSGRALKHVKPHLDMMVRRAVPGKYVVVVTEHGEKLHEAVGEDLRGIADKLFWKTLGDEMLELRGTWGLEQAKEAHDAAE